MRFTDTKRSTRSGPLPTAPTPHDSWGRAAFGPYELQRRLGAGGMAEVFLARRADGRGGPFCIKRILPTLSALPGFADMFRDEAALAKRLVHENIVSVLDEGDVDGVLYMALEYVDGCSLHEALVRSLQRRQPPTVPQALHVRPSIPKRIDTIIGRMLRRRPEQRYATMGEVLDEVTGLLSWLPVGAGLFVVVAGWATCRSGDPTHPA